MRKSVPSACFSLWQAKGRRNGGCGGAALPHGLKIMNLLGRLQIFSYSLGKQSVDGLDEVCLRYSTPVILCVLLAYIEATVSKEGHYICLGYKEDVSLRYS